MKYSILTLAAVLCSVSVAATRPGGTDTLCDTQSPALKQLGDQYYDLDPDLTSSAADARSLEQLYARLQGRWSGEQIDNTCVGTGDSLRLQTRSSKVNNAYAEVRFDGLFTIHRGRSSGENVFTTRIDLYPASDLTSLRVLDQNTVTMGIRYRQSNRYAAGSILRERKDTVSLLGRTLNIKTDWYANGYYVGTETITLIKKG